MGTEKRKQKRLHRYLGKFVPIISGVLHQFGAREIGNNASKYELAILAINEVEILKLIKFSFVVLRFFACRKEIN